MEIKIKFKKPIYENGIIIYYLLKTNTNRYILENLDGKILAQGKNNILKYIYESKKRGVNYEN